MSFVLCRSQENNYRPHRNEDQNGKGFGNDLLLEAISYAREKDLTIIPLCPCKHVFDKTPNIKMFYN
jgi:predicted GNAT family acetyltransferase